jgi:hypothetical protein
LLLSECVDYLNGLFLVHLYAHLNKLVKRHIVELLVAEILIAAIGSLCTTVWIFLGNILKSFYQKHFRAVNVVMSLTLGECVYSMLAQ